MGNAQDIERLEAEQRDQRKDLAINAACEIEGLTEVLMREIDPGASDIYLRGMLMRARQLSQLIVSSLEDYGHPVDDIEYEITGVRPTADAKAG